MIGNAQIVDTLDEALAGCSLVVGTSARSRTLPWPMLDPRECGLKSVSEAEQAPVRWCLPRARWPDQRRTAEMPLPCGD